MTPERIEEIKEFLEKFGQLPGHMALELLAALEEAQQQNEFLEISISAAIDHWEDTEKLLAEAQQTIARITVERDDALTWDGIGTVSRINKVLKGDTQS